MYLWNIESVQHQTEALEMHLLSPVAVTSLWLNLSKLEMNLETPQSSPLLTDIGVGERRTLCKSNNFPLIIGVF